MKNLILVICFLTIIGCNNAQDRVNADETITYANNITTYNNKPYTGIIFKLYKNGELAWEQNLQDGKSDGIFKQWHENGQLSYIANYKEGKKEGEYKTYDKEGNLFMEANYKDGKRDGVFKEFFQNGNVAAKAIYKEKQLKSCQCWDEDGNEVDCPDWYLNDIKNR